MKFSTAQLHPSHQRLQPLALLFMGIGVVALLSLLLFSVGDVQAQAQFGTNWTGFFFNNTTVSGDPIYSQIFPSGLNINWGTSSPAPGVVNENDWSARFDSVQLFNQGTYEFVVASDDGVRVFIDNVLVWDRFVPRVLTTDRFQQTLTAGTHAIRVEYVEFVDQAALQFQWFQVSGIPGTGTPFFPGQPGFPTTPTAVPTITPTPLPPIPPGAQTATVIRAQVLLVRSAPYLGAPVVGRILRGQTYQVLGRDPDARWFLLQLSNVQGWSWGYYLFVSGNEFNAPIVGSFNTAGNPAASARAIAQSQATLRLRETPSVLARQTGRIPWGDLLPIIGRTRDGGWVQVVFRGTIGWVAVGYLEILEGSLNDVPITG